ncbi:hypothetical protein [Ammoniphilus resinae]|uniref:Zn-ribbon and HTH transcriptional regulator n=1 Tax=Ammoniphilus resinae TaxID=861532 RepID=A0ABS4GIW7_9BACL|nr:hypothetical protein [Ammoniphilus resinae]MBP1930037.1 putative Zn-ribbon and HTH transcriptional regulator [Ammoniphilus resinae]
MRNVVINKLARLVFTEQQLMGYWKRHGQELEFKSLTNEQLMALAKKMYEESSHTALEQHVLGRGWRTDADIEGKMLADDDSDPSIHIEVIDTSQDGSATKILVDRVMQVRCKSCQFEFYIEDHVNTDEQKIQCPSCGGEVETVKQKRIINRV